MRTIAHTYSTYSEASSVVTALESAGIPHSDISIVSGDQAAGPTGSVMAPGMTSGDPAQGASTGAGTGATLGTVLGGGAGLLAGIGSLAIPGIGPLVAAGWLVAALTGAGVGAAAGGLVGSLTGAGVSEADAQTYHSEVSSGRTLVTARVDESQAAQVEQMMGKTGPMLGSTTAMPSAMPTAGYTGMTTADTAMPGTTVPGSTTVSGSTTVPGSTTVIGTTSGGTMPGSAAMPGTTTVVGSHGTREVGGSTTEPSAVPSSTPGSMTEAERSTFRRDDAAPGSESTLRRDIEAGEKG